MKNMLLTLCELEFMSKIFMRITVSDPIFL